MSQDYLWFEPTIRIILGLVALCAIIIFIWRIYYVVSGKKMPKFLRPNPKDDLARDIPIRDLAVLVLQGIIAVAAVAILFVIGYFIVNWLGDRGII